MGWLDDVLEQSIDRLVEKRLAKKIDAKFADRLVITVEETIKNSVELAVKTKISAALDKSMKDMDDALDSLKGLDKKLKLAAEKADKVITEKLKNAANTIDLNVNLDKTNVNDKLAVIFATRLITAAQYNPGYNSSNYLVPILRAKLKAKVEKLELS